MTHPSQIDATLQLGKDGVTDLWLEELREQLKKRKLVKVRLLKTTKGEKSSKEIAAEIAERSGARIVDVRGSVAVFADPSFRDR